MNLENEVFDAFEAVVHQDYPNPQRINCPGHSILRKLAADPRPPILPLHWLTYRQCAPCFDELKELRQKGRIRTR